MKLLSRCPILLLCVLLQAVAQGESTEVASAAHRMFRISGTILNARDGAPVSRCRLEVTPGTSTVTPASNVPRAQPADDEGSPRGGERAQRFADRRPSAGAEPAQEGLTDARGRFSITVPRAGVWRLQASARGYVTQGYDQHESFSSDIALSEAAPEQTIVFHLAPESSIAGRVFDEAGEAVRTAQVRVERLMPKVGGEGFQRTQQAGFGQTDDRGHYEVSGLSPGSYRVNVQARPWYAMEMGRNGSPTPAADLLPPDPSLDVVYPLTWYPGVTLPEGAGTLVLHSGEDRQADFTLTPAPAIHLLVPMDATNQNDGRLGNPGTPPTVLGSSGSGQFGFSGSLGNDGKNWDIGGLAPGSYQVRLAGQNGQPVRQLQLQVVAGQAGPVTLVNAVAAVKLSVVLMNEDGSETGQVTLVDTETGQTYQTTGIRRRGGRPPADDASSPADDASARIRSVLVPPHRYEVRLAGNQNLYVTGMSATGATVVGRTIVITDGSPVLTIQQSMGRSTLTGVARRDGSAAAGAMLLLVPAGFGQPGNIAPVLREETNTDGSFTLQNIIPGQYILSVIDHGWDVNWQDPSTLAHYLASGVPLDLKPAGSLQQDVTAQLP